VYEIHGDCVSIPGTFSDRAAELARLDAGGAARRAAGPLDQSRR